MSFRVESLLGLWKYYSLINLCNRHPIGAANSQSPDEDEIVLSHGNYKSTLPVMKGEIFVSNTCFYFFSVCNFSNFESFHLKWCDDLRNLVIFYKYIKGIEFQISLILLISNPKFRKIVSFLF